MKAAQEKAQACMPAPRDFLPSRFARKTSMVIGYAALGAVIPTIVSTASGSWTQFSSTSSTGQSGAAVSTSGDIGLARFRITDRLSDGTRHTYTGELTDLAVSAGDLPNYSGVTLGLLLVCIFVFETVSAWLSFRHAWARGDQRKNYLWAVNSHFGTFVVLLAALLVYAAGEPRNSDFSLGWGFFLLLIIVIFWFILAVGSALDKPSGFVVVTKQGVQPDEEDPELPGGSSYIMAATESPGGPKAAAVSTVPEPMPAVATGHAPASLTTPRTCIALFKCEAERPGDLEFEKGEIITIISDAPGGGWITGTIGSKRGILPANYVKPSDP